MKKIFSVLFFITMLACTVIFSSCGAKLNSESKVYRITFIQANGERLVRNIVDGQVSAPKINDKRGYIGAWSVKDFSLINQDTEVYAEYTPIVYTVTLDADSGVLTDGKNSILQIEFDSDYKLPVAEKEHYEFVTWKYNGGSIASEGVWNIDENVTLTAEYKELQKFEVRFIDGYKDIIKTVYKGESLEDIPSPAERVGYSAVWNIKDFNNITTNLEVTAKYTPNKYTVTLNPNGGEFSDGTSAYRNIEVTFDTEYELPIVAKNGYKFLSWKISDNKSVAISGKWNVADDVTLTADYLEKTIREITFIQDDCDDVVICVEEGAVLTDIPAPQPKRGYTVTWDVVDFENFTGLTVHAVYTPNKYIVTLNPNGGTLTSGKTEYTVTYDENYKLEIPEKKGYDFIAWEFNGRSVLLEGKWNIDENVNLKAEYREKVKRAIRFVQSGYDDIIINIIDGEQIKEEDIPKPRNVDGYDVVWDIDLKNMVISKDLIVKAELIPKIYKASFVVRGKVYKVVDIQYKAELIFPVINEKGFLYWTTDEITGNLTERVLYEFTGDITFRACFDSSVEPIEDCIVKIVLKDEDKNKNIPQIKTLFTVKVGENLNLYLEYPEDNSQYVIDYYYFIDEVGNKVEIKQGKVVKCPDISDLVIYIELKMQWTKNY